MIKPSRLPREAKVLDEILSGRLTLQEMADGIGQIPHLVTHSGEAYDLAYLDYMHTLAFAVNPYTPTKFDLDHYTNDSALYFLRDTASKWANASDWLKFAKGFWDGSVAGGIVGTVVLAVATAGVGAAVFAAIKGLSVVQALIKAMEKIVDKAMDVIRPILDSVKATATYKRVAIAAARVWTAAADAPATLAESATDFFKAAQKQVDAVAQRAHAWYRANHAVVNRVACVVAVGTLSCALGAPPPGAIGSFVQKGARMVAIDGSEDLITLAGIKAVFKITSREAKATLKKAFDADPEGTASMLSKWKNEFHLAEDDFDFIFRGKGADKQAGRFLERFEFRKEQLEAGVPDPVEIEKVVQIYSGKWWRGRADILNTNRNPIRLIEAKSGSLRSIEDSFREGSTSFSQMRKYQTVLFPNAERKVRVFAETFVDFLEGNMPKLTAASKRLDFQVEPSIARAETGFGTILK